MRITYDKSSKGFIMSSFNLIGDSEGYLVKKDRPSERLRDISGEYLKVKDFGGVKKGSEIYIGSDVFSLIKLCRSLSSNNDPSRVSQSN